MSLTLLFKSFFAPLGQGGYRLLCKPCGGKSCGFDLALDLERPYQAFKAPTSLLTSEIYRTYQKEIKSAYRSLESDF